MAEEKVKETKAESYRDSLSTVTEDGKRNWIYPKKPSGKFYKARTIVAIFLLAFLVITPFIKVNGHPFMILNVLDRKFILFGIPFGPHDFYLFGLAMITIFVSIFLFTVVYGRIFCGWVCPQTIFMEMVFRKIEYWIEGDANKQIALNKAPWTKGKIFKKTSKHIIFFGIAFFISNIFLAYIIGMDELLKIITDPPSQHLGGLTAMIAFSGVFYWIFASFREQVCTMVCPYGRLQGVMLDQNSIVIAYDNIRGEPRGKIKKGVKQDLGDCIDCHLCVDVCPTGIDIRNGTQLECVNCTACIDACDYVMEKVNRPKGLIRYASKNEIEKKVKSIFTPRAIGYTVVLVLLFGLLSFSLANRSNLEMSVLRTPGLLSQQQPGNKLSNIYDLKIMNKTFDKFPFQLKLSGIDGEIKILGENQVVPPQGVLEAKFLVILPDEEIHNLKTDISVEVLSKGKIIDKVKTAFIGNVKKEHREKTEEKEED